MVYEVVLEGLERDFEREQAGKDQRHHLQERRRHRTIGRQNKSKKTENEATSTYVRIESDRQSPITSHQSPNDSTTKITKYLELNEGKTSTS